MSVPFFSDFTKRTKDYFKRDKYALGQVLEISNQCQKDIKLKTKVSNGSKVKTKFSATLKRDKGREIEMTEDLSKGLTVKFVLPKFYKSWDLTTEHTSKDLDVKLKYKPSADSDRAFYNTKISGYYNPDKNGNRLCRTTAEFAVGDDQLNLSVGGDITIVDEADNSAPFGGMDARVDTYRLGFLYTPTPDSVYSVIYTPDKDSPGMEYSFTAFRQMSKKCSLAAKAEGKVDTKKTDYAPTVSLAGGWTLGSNYMQAFVNSNKEWGLAYKVKVSDTASLNLGVASYLSDGAVSTELGYKLQV